MPSISTHVLDTSRSTAAGLAVTLYRLTNGGEGRSELKRSVTNADGRVGDLFSDELDELADFCLKFDTGGYFADAQIATFYPQVEVIFRVSPSQKHYHVPLLLAPFGYSTYRGS